MESESSRYKINNNELQEAMDRYIEITPYIALITTIVTVVGSLALWGYVTSLIPPFK